MPNLSELLYVIQQFLKCYEKQMNHTAEHYQLTTTELNILLFLANHPDMDTARDIVELRGLPKSCVSRAVDSLIRQGFLESREDKNDRRILHLSILPAADGLTKDIQLTQQNFLALMYQNFTPEECRIHEKLSKKLLDNILSAKCDS